MYHEIWATDYSSRVSRHYFFYSPLPFLFFIHFLIYKIIFPTSKQGKMPNVELFNILKYIFIKCTSYSSDFLKRYIFAWLIASSPINLDINLLNKIMSHDYLWPIEITPQSLWFCDSRKLPCLLANLAFLLVPSFFNEFFRHLWIWFIVFLMVPFQ